MSVSVDVEAVERAVRDRHGDLLEGVGRAADAAIAARPEPVTDADALVAALRGELGARAVLERLPAVLETAVGAAGLTLPAESVAAPPYVVVTSRGPVCRATVDEGRLVLVCGAIAVKRDSPPRYVRTGATRPLEVEWHTG